MLVGKLKKLEDHDLLDQILKELSKYASTNHIFQSTINNCGIYRSLEKEDENIKSINEHLLIAASMWKSLFPLVKQLKMCLILST